MGIAPVSDLLLVLLGSVAVMLVNAPGVGLHQLGLHLPDNRILLGLVESHCQGLRVLYHESRQGQGREERGNRLH